MKIFNFIGSILKDFGIWLFKMFKGFVLFLIAIVLGTVMFGVPLCFMLFSSEYIGMFIGGENVGLRVASGTITLLIEVLILIYLLEKYSNHEDPIKKCKNALTKRFMIIASYFSKKWNDSSIK